MFIKEQNYYEITTALLRLYHVQKPVDVGGFWALARKCFVHGIEKTPRFSGAGLFLNRSNFDHLDVVIAEVEAVAVIGSDAICYDLLDCVPAKVIVQVCVYTENVSCSIRAFSVIHITALSLLSEIVIHLLPNPQFHN